VEVEFLFGIPAAAAFHIYIYKYIYIFCKSNCQTWLMTYKWKEGAGLKWHLKDIRMLSTWHCVPFSRPLSSNFSW